MSTFTPLNTTSSSHFGDQYHGFRKSQYMLYGQLCLRSWEIDFDLCYCTPTEGFNSRRTRWSSVCSPEAAVFVIGADVFGLSLITTTKSGKEAFWF